MARMNHRPLATVVFCVLLRAAGAGQERAAVPPVFDVVSIKPNPNDSVPEAIALGANGDVRLTAFPARTLITIAYRAQGIQRFDQLVAAPAWLSDRFDIVAKGASGGGNQLPEMLRSLLRDRFRLQVYTETRSMPAFRLVVARPGRLGPGLHESTIDCAAVADSDRRCGIRAAGGVITGRSVTAAQLAGNLSGYPTIDRFVTDRTGLTGRYDFRLEYSPAFLQPADPAANAGPSLFTALTEQLGLTLEPETIQAPVLVIDHIERPTPD